MANVFLSVDAYARLKASKKKGQSFSDVIMENVPQNLDLKDYLGACKEIDSDKTYAEIKKERER